ncbi:helix-turn-helix transcriptional regulator [Bacillus sp. ISL-8]|nr:helix-turn-helix transcriptional regulator [Bacillus sp. ISL-8]
MALFNKTNSTVLRKVREEKDLTVQDVSKGTKIPENTLYSIELGRSGVKTKRARAISSYLKEPLERLFESSSYHAKLEDEYPR